MGSTGVKRKLKLNDGRYLPAIGLGVYNLKQGPHTENAVRWALDAGYRHVDTATFYANEQSVGKAVNEHHVKREKVWITTKIWPTDFAHPRKAIERSLKELNTGYIDLYLIHWPTPVEIPGFDKKLWRKLESFREEGLCKSIGVSNYQPKRLEKLLSFANIPPVVNQVRCSPMHYPKELHKFCTENDIKIIGYSPLNEGRGLNRKILQELAQKYNKSAAQVMLRWAIQKGVIPIPKSQSKPRIEENIAVFDFKLSRSELKQLESLLRN